MKIHLNVLLLTAFCLPIAASQADDAWLLVTENNSKAQKSWDSVAHKVVSQIRLKQIRSLKEQLAHAKVVSAKLKDNWHACSVLADEKLEAERKAHVDALSSLRVVAQKHDSFKATSREQFLALQQENERLMADYTQLNEHSETTLGILQTELLRSHADNQALQAESVRLQQGNAQLSAELKAIGERAEGETVVNALQTELQRAYAENHTLQRQMYVNLNYAQSQIQQAQDELQRQTDSAQTAQQTAQQVQDELISANAFHEAFKTVATANREKLDEAELYSNLLHEAAIKGKAKREKALQATLKKVLGARQFHKVWPKIQAVEKARYAKKLRKGLAQLEKIDAELA